MPWLLACTVYAPSLKGQPPGFLQAEEAGETKHRLLSEMVENWDKIFTEEKGKYLKRLIQCFMKPKEDSDFMYILQILFNRYDLW